MKSSFFALAALLVLLTAAPAQAQLENGFLEFDLDNMSFHLEEGNLATHLAYTLHCANAATFTLEDGWTLRVESVILRDGKDIQADWAPETVETLIEHRFCATSTSADAAVDLEVQAPRGLAPGDYSLLATATASAGDFTTKPVVASYTVAQVPGPAPGPAPIRAVEEPAAQVPGPALPLLALAALATAAVRRRA